MSGLKSVFLLSLATLFTPVFAQQQQGANPARPGSLNYVEGQASIDGRTLDSLPLSMANTLESERSGVEVGLHGESIVVAAHAAAGGVLTGQQILSLRVESGGGLR